jgi:hypothetical protein
MENIISTKDGVVQNILYITIGCLLASFTSRLYDVVTKKSNDTLYSIDDSNNKMMTMLVLGFVYLFGGVYASKNMSSPALRGISLGGLFLIFYHIVINWGRINELHQLLIMGVILATLIYLGSGLSFL